MYELPNSSFISIILSTASGDNSYLQCLQNLSTIKVSSEVILLFSGRLDNAEKEKRYKQLKKQFPNLDLKILYAPTSQLEQQYNQASRLARKKFLWFFPTHAKLKREDLQTLDDLKLETGKLYYADCFAATTIKSRRLTCWILNFISSSCQRPFFEQGLLIDRSSFKNCGEFSTSGVRTDALFAKKASSKGVQILSIPLKLYLSEKAFWRWRRSEIKNFLANSSALPRQVFGL